MARRADELVRQIRARRRGLRAALDALLATDELARRVRRDPWSWLAGGAAVGVVAGRLLPSPVLEAGRRGINAVLAPRLRTAILGLFSAAFASHADDGQTAAAAEATGDEGSGSTLAGSESLR